MHDSRPRGLGLAAALAVLLLAHVVYGLVPALRGIGSDFANYYVPAQAWVSGRDVGRLYERAVFDLEMRRAGLPGLGSFVPHPPANAGLLAPLARLPAPAAKGAWTLVLAAAYVAAFVVLHRCGLAPVDGSRGAAWLALVALLPSAALTNALAYGQPYPLLLLFLCLSLLAAVRGRWMTAGLLLSPVLVLKLYGLPLLAAFVLARRARAAAGVVIGALLLVVLTIAGMGRPVHEAYVREVLPASLEGRIQDPYSTIWQSASSLTRRLLEREPDLNPDAAFDRPDAASAAARAVTVSLGVLAALAAASAATPAQLWAIAVTGALVASPLGATYHFVLLGLPVAVWTATERRPAANVVALGLYAFATSSLPHYFARWAHGLAAPLAYPRLFAGLALFAIVGAPLLTRRRVALAAAAGALTFVVAPRASRDAGWERLAAGGYLAAEPLACGGAFGWLAIEAGEYVVRGSDGTRERVNEAPQVPVCRDGAIRAGAPLADRVEDRARFGAPARHVRRSPDGARLVAQVWRAGSWNVETASPDGRIDRLTDDAANEVEPSWSEDGRHVLFASDRGRGLGSTAIYRIAAPDGRLSAR